MQRRHFMKLTGMLATLPAIKGIAATSEKPAPSGKQLYAVSYTHLKAISFFSKDKYINP